MPAFPASTPWQTVWFARGRGTSAPSFPTKSARPNDTCQVPSLQVYLAGDRDNDALALCVGVAREACTGVLHPAPLVRTGPLKWERFRPPAGHPLRAGDGPAPRAVWPACDAVFPEAGEIVVLEEAGASICAPFSHVRELAGAVLSRVEGQVTQGGPHTGHPSQIASTRWPGRPVRRRSLRRRIVQAVERRPWLHLAHASAPWRRTASGTGETDGAAGAPVHEERETDSAAGAPRCHVRSRA